jgi:cellobiose phosphorylase
LQLRDPGGSIPARKPRLNQRVELSSMPDTKPDSGILRFASPSGLRVEVNANGSMRRMDCNGLTLSLFVGNEVEGGPTNLFLRRRGSPLEWTTLLGPLSPTRFEADPTGRRLTGNGTWMGINYRLGLVLAQNAKAWFWHVRLENTSAAPLEVDLTYAQDVALASYGGIRLNEYYVSQYLDHTPLRHPKYGQMVATRQNLAVDGRFPWCLIGSLREGDSFATDARQFHGLASRAGEAPVGMTGELPGRRLQHEHAMVVIRDAALRLEPRGRVDAGFFGLHLENHPEATLPADAQRAQVALELPEAQPAAAEPGATAERGAVSASTHATLFSSAPLLNTLDLDLDTLRKLFGSDWRHEEVDEQGVRLSFFNGADRHVVLRSKELRVLRPHGHILRTGRHTTPDETALTSTAWMNGVFHSMVTQGHVSINRFLSTTHTYLGLFRSHGQRVFAQIGGRWHLLNVPSAFEMTPDACRWIYHYQDGTIEVRAEARSEPQELTLSIQTLSGPATRFLISHHVALNDDDGSAPGAALWRLDGDRMVLIPAPGTDLGRRFPNGSFHIAPLAGTKFQQVGGDELLFLDERSRQQPFVCVITAPASSATLTIRGHLVPAEGSAPLYADPAVGLIPRVALSMGSSASADAEHLAHVADIIPWFTHNALVHYLSPRGLEQYSGGGWGTRDVCQGPVEMLLALDRVEPIRDLLLRVMQQQNPDGDWPQWFMFFERERGIRPGDSHGDIVFWPLVVLAQYLTASGDKAVLDETVRFFDSGSPEAGEQATVWQHVQRALSLIENRLIPGTALAAYGHGDWNDSLQPADPALREHMCSAWTVTLHYQTLNMLARALRAIGKSQEAAPLEAKAQAVHRDFQRLLLVDGVLTGYAIFDGVNRLRYLLHPDDKTTGIKYSSLAMIHAIIEDMLTPEQTREHLALIDEYLSAPDGVRLFDRPMPYHGGLQQIFQRAETATFFGREIGLMYTHAHLRYAQALAHVGDADRFFRALCQANPIGISSIVPTATLRQANCYYSSSDAAFEDRYHASDEYERIARGTIALDGGWRVYSSGAGIALGLTIRRFLGLSCEAQVLRVDPVIPASLDGLRVATTLRGRPLEVRYQIGKAGCGVTKVGLNGHSLSFTTEPNPHRRGAALVELPTVLKQLEPQQNVLTIRLG